MKLSQLSFAFVATFLSGLSIVPKMAEAFPYDDVGVDCIDLEKMQGSWYELFTTQYVRDTMEKGCDCSQAYYSLDTNSTSRINVRNGCMQVAGWIYVDGYAEQVNPIQYPGQFNLTANGQITSYNVLKTWRDENGGYPYTLLGSSSPDQLWLLGRNSLYPEQKIVDSAIRTAINEGYNTWLFTFSDSRRCEQMPID